MVVKIYTGGKMLNKIIVKFILLIFITINVFAYETGLIKKIYVDSKRNRNFSTNIYYPTLSNKKITLVGDNPVFMGIEVRENVPVADLKFPLIILVHGSGGNNTNLNYLVDVLVSKGIIVVAANYPGSTTGNSIPKETVQAWIQNEDVSFLLDEVLKDKEINNNILIDSIGIMGHSKGAYTSIAKIGGKLNLDDFINYCAINPQMPDCVFYKSGNVDFKNINRLKFEKSYIDERFSYAVSIDPGYALSFDKESLKNIKIPLLLILADFYSPSDTKEDLFGDVIYENLNKEKLSYKKIKDSGHFSFLAKCKKQALMILAEEDEDEMIICQDGKKSRNDVHQETIETVLQFLEDNNIINSKN